MRLLLLYGILFFIWVYKKGEIHERPIENAGERGLKGAELRRSPDYLMPKLFLDKIHCMCIFYSVFKRSTTRVNTLCYIDISKILRSKDITLPMHAT